MDPWTLRYPAVVSLACALLVLVAADYFTYPVSPMGSHLPYDLVGAGWAIWRRLKDGDGFGHVFQTFRYAIEVAGVSFLASFAVHVVTYLYLTKWRRKE